jgi:hypothetical protein
MNKSKLAVSAFGLALVLSAPSAFAVQFGVGMGVQGGVAQGVDEDEDWEFRRSGAEIGFLLDTSRPDSVFNYRLLVSYAAGESDEFEFNGQRILGDYTEDFSELSLTNTFRFDLIRGNASFWVGPSIYLASVQYEDQDGEDVGSGASLGFGPSLGLDLLVGVRTKLCLEAGYRYAVTALDDEGFEDNGDDEFAFETSDLLLRFGVLF